MNIEQLDIKTFVQEYCIKSLVCCFSGGRDSLVATHYTLKQLEDVHIDKHVVYVDTGAMLPTTEPYVEKVCAVMNWRLTVLHGHFFEKAKINGMPRMKHRWCCYECKLKPIIDFVKDLKPQRGEITGLRRDESARRAKLPKLIYRSGGPAWGFAPIISWSSRDVRKYIRENSLPDPPNYRLGLKETCMCGVFSTRQQMLILKARFPELFQKFVDLEASFRTGGAAFYFNYKPVRAEDLAKQKVLA